MANRERHFVNASVAQFHANKIFILIFFKD
ncbi:hypothetical protein FHW67_001960 [Herbaspirillum sp. Sphag1AN]|nr:hypothetical protein [Herbaspirillum sp. Sphag1AN]MBB3245874.1 hypothetical protein [Herbaspirillum sp. Sphag64]